VTVITITGLGDHDQLDWLITMTGIRSVTNYRELPHGFGCDQATE